VSIASRPILIPLRRILGARFPGVKFSVQDSRYEGNSSVDIRWTDGPTRRQVEDVAAGFVAAETVSATRSLSGEFRAELTERIMARNGMHEPTSQARIKIMSQGPLARVGGELLRDLIYREEVTVSRWVSPL
jgi:hypothetical protein